MKYAGFLFVIFFAFITNAVFPQAGSYVFTAASGVYTPITGTSVLLTGNGSSPVADEGYANNIPLGFNFVYLGTTYSTIGASTNGFAAFGNMTSAVFSNSISNGGGLSRPLLAPFWEDLAIGSPSDLQYSTSGPAGTRVFVLQWSNVQVDFGATAPSISFQLRLYETSNVIEFIYNKLPGAVEDFSGGASIGITGTPLGNYVSLNNSSGTAVANSSIPTNNIVARPATGQVYRFTPPACINPGGLTVTNVTTNAATVTWNFIPGNSYEYAVSTSLTPPASGTVNTTGSLALTGLASGAQYYVHVRTSCGGSFSPWSTMGFMPACNATNIPYTMPLSSAVCPALPSCVMVKDENLDGSTWRTYCNAGPSWTGQVIAYVYNPNETTPANDWLFTQGLNLTAGTYYRLKFKYNNDSTSLFPEKLKVAFGNSNSAVAMTNVLVDYTSVFSASPKIAVIDFTPPASGVYYIGFQAHSNANEDVLILDDISVDFRPSCDVPSGLSVNVASTGTSASFSWTPPGYGTPAGYEYAVTTVATPPASGTAITATSLSLNNLLSNTRYYLHVRTNCSGSFSQWTSLSFGTVGNDEACNAMPLTAGAAPVCANNSLATTSAIDPPSNCSFPDHTLWYKYTATVTGTVVLHITTPAAPANPLRGWAGWYEQTSGSCPNIGLTSYGYCGEFGNNGNNDVDDIVSPVLVAGNTYFIMIDGYSDDLGDFCISIPACPPAVAVTISDILGSSAEVSWSGTGNFILEYGPAGFIPGTGSVPGTGGTIINQAVAPLSLIGLAYSTTYDVYLRQDCSGTGDGYSNNSVVARFTTKGQPPSNDECAGAIVLPINSVCSPVAGTTVNATMSPINPIPSCGDEPGGWDDDVWYKFTPAAGQIFVNVNFAVTGGYSDIAAQIYTSSTNNCSGTFSLFQCSDDGGTSNLPQFTGIRVVPGTTYFIRVFADTVNVSSQFTICVSKSLPPNDEAAGAVNINVGAGCTGAIYTNETATQSTGEPAGSCSSTTGYATVWFKFIAPPSGAVRISTAAGAGNTLTNTRVALFQANNVNNYNSFSIIGCDEDGGSGAFGNMSVLYATGLVVDNAYYIQVDKFDNNTAAGTFCLTVDEISPAMLSAAANCNTNYQVPVGSVPGYNGWVSLMDDNSRLIAMVRNTAGGAVNAYNVVQNINAGAIRKDVTSGEYYLDRSYTINNTASPSAPLVVQLFFLNSDLDKLKTADAAASLPYLRVTKQTATTCQPAFVTGNGTNTELSQTSYGSGNGVSWLVTNTSGYANYYIHAIKSFLSAKVFLQGAFDPQLNRHKNVTSAWANVLNTYALKQPYDNSANTDTAKEGYGAVSAGGAGQQVVHVTNLNANGPGSLFAAMGSNRTIVFDVAGTINNFGWEASGNSNVSFLTIDGSTAPSPGITINNGSLGNGFSFNNLCHDVIIKNIRVRNAGNDGINVIGGFNFVFDHVSISGSGDGDLDLTDGAHDITVQWSIFGPGKNGWSGAMLIAYPGTKNISLHHNLYTTYGSGVGERNPLVHNATNFTPNPVDYLMADFTNNIVWKWGNITDDGFGYGSGVDYGGTMQCRNNFYQSLLAPSNAIIVNHNTQGAKLYASGNVSGNPGINPNAAATVTVPWTTAFVTKQDACAGAALVIQKAGPRPLDDADQAFVNSVSLSNCPSMQNLAPLANAGSNVTVQLPNNSINLSGSGTDGDGTIVTYSWSLISGPPTYLLGTPNAANTTLSNLVKGNYVFRLTVTDNNGFSGTDDITVSVVDSGNNQPPVANAGGNRTITLPVNSTILNGSGNDADGTVTTYTWSLVSGPANYTITSPNSAITPLSNLVPGTYVFNLTVVDNTGAVGSDNVTINVIAASSNSITGYAGSEKVSPGLFVSNSSLQSDIIDWVLLEIKSTSGDTRAQRAAFVREDGKIVDLDGVSPVSLYGLQTGSYYVTVRHRNHLGISTQNTLSFGAESLGVPASLPANFDFTTAPDSDIFGDALAYKVIGGTNVMIGGNVNLNTSVRFTGPNNDAVAILAALGGNQATIINSIYNPADVNMDGLMKFTGPINDSAWLLAVLLGNQAAIINEQKR